jgi:hypothetical protein
MTTKQHQQQKQQQQRGRQQDSRVCRKLSSCCTLLLPGKRKSWQLLPRLASIWLQQLLLSLPVLLVALDCFE